MLESPRDSSLNARGTTSNAVEQDIPVRPFSAMGQMFGGGFVPHSYHHYTENPFTSRSASAAAAWNPQRMTDVNASHMKGRRNAYISACLSGPTAVLLSQSLLGIRRRRRRLLGRPSSRIVSRSAAAAIDARRPLAAARTRLGSRRDKSGQKLSR